MNKELEITLGQSADDFIERKFTVKIGDCVYLRGNNKKLADSEKLAIQLKKIANSSFIKRKLKDAV